MAAVIVDNKDLGRVRRELRLLIPPGQRRIHFTSDSTATRQRTVARMLDLPIEVLLAVGPAHTRQAAARTWCLTQITANTGKGDRLILEIDRGIVDHDRNDLDRLTRQDGQTYSHMTAHSDPGLWLPDGIAWCWTRGGSWKEAITPLIVKTISAR